MSRSGVLKTSNHAGEVCVSVQRIYIHPDLNSAFLARVAARVAALKVGAPPLGQTEVGPLIHAREADRALAWTEEGVGSEAQRSWKLTL